MPVFQQDGFFVAKLYKLSNKKKDEVPSAGRSEQAHEGAEAEAEEEEEEDEEALRPRSKQAPKQQKRPCGDDAPPVKAKKATAAAGGEARRIAGRPQKKDRR